MKLTTRSLRIALIPVLLAAFCEAGLAAQDFAGAAAVFQAIPAALRTPADGKWTLEQTSKVNAWLKEHVEGKTVGVPFELDNSALK